MNANTAFLPLHPNSREIRCVLLLPGSGNDPTACELVYTNIDEGSDTRVPYTALSYCWGNVEDAVEIDLHGPSTRIPGAYQAPISTRFRITRNLHVALHALRDESKQCLWIDAVCINQQDLREKTHQVQLMGKIYSSAEFVLVWLGPEDKYSRCLLRAWTAHVHPLTKGLGLKSVGSLRNQIHDTSHPLWVNMAQDEVLNQLALELDSKWTQNSSPHRYRKAMRVSFNGLLHRPWWSRLWVVQEVLLAPKREGGSGKVEFRIGDKKLHWQDILHINLLNAVLPRSLLEAMLQHIPLFNREIQASWKSLFIRDGFNMEHNIKYLLMFTMRFHASDPRDKFFALLLLASDTRECFRQEPLICPDYTKSTKAVFDDLVRWKPTLRGTWIWVKGRGFVELTGDSDWSEPSDIFQELPFLHE